MPRIVEYNAEGNIAPNDESVRSARDLATVSNIFARESGQAVGGAITRVGGQIGHSLDAVVQEAKEHEDRQQIGFGAAQSAALWADLTRNVNDTMNKSDPNDTSVGPGLMEKTINPSLEKFTQSFDNARPAVQKWAMSTADTMRQHFTKTIVADEMTRAAVAVGRNVGELERGLSIVANNDPTSLTAVIEKFDADLSLLVGSRTLTVQQQAMIDKEVPKIKERLALSAFEGAANRNPQAAIEALNRGDYNKYADAVTQQQWKKFAEGLDKAQKADLKRDAMEARDEKRQLSVDKMEQYIGQMYDPNTGRIKPPAPNANMAIINDPDLLWKEKNFAIRWNQANYRAQLHEDKMLAKGNSKGAGDNQVELKDMIARIGTDQNPLTKEEVVDALGAELITRKTAHDLMWRLNQRDADVKTFQQQYNTQFANVRHAITGSAMNAVNPERAAQVINRIDAAAQEVIRNTPAGAERRALLDPNSKTYLFRPDAVRAQTPRTLTVIDEAASKIRGGERVTTPSPRQALPTAVNPGTGETLVFKEGKWQRP